MADRSEYWKKRWAEQKAKGTTPDRHEYWKKRWEEEKSKSPSSTSKSNKKKSKSKKDRHRKGYYHDYNQAHPERLERGFTKGYVNGNVSEGLKTPQPNYPDGCIEVLGDGYYIDRMGWTRHIDPMTDMLTIKEQEWHDDNWCENPWGE